MTVLPLVYGSAFDASTTPALILLPGTVALGLTHVALSSLTGRGHPRAFLTPWLITLPMATALYAVLVPAHGATGAAVASSLSYTAAAGVAMGLVVRAARRSPRHLFVPGSAEVADYRRLAQRAIRRRAAARQPSGIDAET